ncbi:PAAR-like protein [Flavobacterium sp.]|uniref:PAAR-like protein n=1 Tax=Flavobacterium sp. TaxID=239 RepID=UPI003751A5CB
MSENQTPRKQTIEEIEAERSKILIEIDKREKEKEKAEEDQQLVIDMAVLECKLCTNPVGMLKVNYNTPTTQNKKTATVKEKDNKSLIFTGTCIKSPNSSSPCASVMQLGEWKDVGTIKFQDEIVLIKKSTIMCNYGSSIISIKKSGQINVPSQIEPFIKNDKEILSAIWIDKETKEEIKNGIVGDNVTILVKTKNYKPGQTVFLDITEAEENEVKNGKTIITVSGIVQEDGTAELSNHYTI